MIESENSQITYILSASTVYSFPIKFFDKSDIVVYLEGVGASTKLTPDVDFTVESKEDYSNGANITLTPGSVDLPAIPVGKHLTIMRQLPYRQMTSFPQYGKFPAKENENQLDKIVCQIQQLAEMTGADSYDPVNSGQDPARNQFAVIDVSNGESFKVAVVDGRDSTAGICGTLNNTSYVKTELALDPANPFYYIYAIDGQLYAIAHEIRSDIIPILLIATVSVGTSSIYIRQVNYANDPVVPIVSSTSAVRLSASVNCSKHICTIDYFVTASILQNNTTITAAGQLPASTGNKTAIMAVYAKTLTLPVNTAPETGFTFINTTETEASGYEWSMDILRYQLTSKSFTVQHITENPQFFTFTVVQS